MTQPSIDRAESARYVWYVIGLLTVVNVFNYMDRMALAVLLPFIKADLELSDGQLGLLIGFAFSLFYAICGIPIARWADRGVRRNIIALALGTWSVMTVLSGAAQNFWHLFAARVGLGAGEAGCLPPAQSIISDYVPLKRRPGVYALHTFGLVAGMMMGMVLAGWLGELVGWRWTFVVMGVPGIALALVVRLTLREPSRGRFDAVHAGETTPSLATTLSTLWHCRTYRTLAIYLTSNGFILYGLTQWLPSFYTRVFELSPSAVGVYFGVALGVGQGLGLLIGGLLANWAAQRDIRLPLIVGAVATLLSLPVMCGALFAPTAILSIAATGLAGLLWNISSGTVVASVYSVTRPNMRAMAGTLTIFFTAVLGFGLGPFFVGALSDALRPSLGIEALRYALLAPTALLPVLTVALYAGARTLPHDLKAMGASI